MSQTRMNEEGRYITTVEVETYLPCDRYKPQEPRRDTEVSR